LRAAGGRTGVVRVGVDCALMVVVVVPKTFLMRPGVCGPLVFESC